MRDDEPLAQWQATRPSDEELREAYQRGFDEGWRQALEMMGTDALTGVKSKHAYGVEERILDEAIRSGGQPPFAIVVCDVNSLKLVNDTRGHTAGDERLKRACSIICDVFKHSPVFRFGGDEFVAVLRGSDYDARDALMDQLHELRRHDDGEGAPLFACGIADWDLTTDTSVADVFKRADRAMYEDKRKHRP